PAAEEPGWSGSDDDGRSSLLPARASPSAASAVPAGGGFGRSSGHGGGGGRAGSSCSMSTEKSSGTSGSGRTGSTSNSWWEYIPPEVDACRVPGELMYHGAVMWRGRMIVHGGRVSVSKGDVSSGLWSLAIDVDGAGLDPTISLVEADSDTHEEGGLGLGWTASGVVVFLIAGCLAGWMMKQVLACALEKIRPLGDEDAAADAAADDRHFSTTPVTEPDNLAGLNNFHVAAAAFSPVAYTDGRDGGLSRSEIALLPVRRFAGPSTSTLTAVVSTAQAGAGAGAGATSGIAKTSRSCRSGATGDDE
ncbi:unnamed protein product, partial [Pylaiella littoralis]